MIQDCLDFERPVVELEAKLDNLGSSERSHEPDCQKEMALLKNKIQAQLQSTFANLSTWDTVQLARHPSRPHAVDLIKRVFEDFDPLSGDRTSSDCQAIVGGIATLGAQSVMVIAQEKGRDTKDKIKHNFGMPNPQGFRKAKRLFELAEKFSMPIVTLLDSPGAYAGVDAELHNQSEALASNIMALCSIQTPVVSVVIGEAMSGGAMAVGVCDHCAMLEHAIYAVISPEGCASILWKNAIHAKQAADAMQVTAKHLYAKHLIDAIIPEPLGGAHRDYDQVALSVRQHIQSTLAKLQVLSIHDMLERRHQKWMLRHLSE